MDYRIIVMGLLLFAIYSNIPNRTHFKTPRELIWRIIKVVVLIIMYFAVSMDHG